MSVPNIEKLFQYLQCVSVSPIEFGGYFNATMPKNETKQIIGDQISDIRLNAHFFDNDGCIMCGGCDPAESNVFTYSEYQDIKNCTSQKFIDCGLDPKYLTLLQTGLHEDFCVINGKEVSIWVYPQVNNEFYLPTREKILNRFTWCFKDSEKRFKCRIHPVESITCIMPHLRIFHVKGTHKSSIGISQFGRNWALKCPVILTECENAEQFYRNKQNRVKKLIKLNQVGLDLNIETYLPEVIDYIQGIEFQNYKNFLGKNVISSKCKKLF